MKVICIENKCVDGQLHPFLTINKTYDVNIEDNVYIINNDNIFDEFSYKYFFVTLQQHRNNKLNQIGIE